MGPDSILILLQDLHKWKNLAHCLWNRSRYLANSLTSYVLKLLPSPAISHLSYPLVIGQGVMVLKW